MKVLHAISGYLPESSGGAQLQLRELCLGQLSAGDEILVFARSGAAEREELSLHRSSWEGVEVVSLVNNYADCDRFSRLYRNPTIDRRFTKVVDDWCPDLVHFHHLSGLSTSMVKLARDRGLPTVLTVHDYWMQCLRGQRLHPDRQEICDVLDRKRCLECKRRLWPHLLPRRRRWGGFGRDASLDEIETWERRMKEVLDACDMVLAPSAFHLSRFLEEGLDSARARVAECGLPVEALAAEPRGRRGIRHIGFTGMVLPSKGVHVLLAAFNCLDRPDLVLHIHGEALPYPARPDHLDELRRSVAPGLDVRFHGGYEVEDLPEILAGLDLLVVPSLWWESFCLTAREAALAGLPVIASNLGGLESAVESGLVLGVEAGDAMQLARAIARVCDDAELRDTLTRQAHRIRDSTDYVAQVRGIYEDLV